MKKINTTLTIISLILLCTLVSFVGCSDMMATLGNISLTIDLDTPEVEVASYILEGNLVDSNSRFTLNNIVPPRHTLSELKQGRWNLTVKAFDDQDNQIGIGTKAIDLRAGQVVDTSLLVVFGQSTPLASAFTIAGPSRNADREGTISGTTVKMEYRLASAAADDPFTACTSGTTQLVPGTYHIRLAQAHGLQASECLTFTVPAYQKIQLTIAAPTLTTTKEYDGTSTVQGSITPGAPSGVRSGDEVVVHAQASYDSASVGNSKNITVAYFLGGADANNYLAPANTSFSGAITKKALTVITPSIQLSKEYDGTPTAVVTTPGSLVGILSGDSVTLLESARYADKDVGSPKSITVSYVLTGSDADNYTAPQNYTFTTPGTITARQLTATIGSYTKVYGEENPSFSINVSGFVNGENSSTADGYFAPTVSTTATTTSIAGTYPITITGGSATNYSFNNSDIGTLTINKATYDMSAISFTDKTVTYNGTEQSLPISGTLPSGVTVSYTNNAKTDAGTYTATAHFSGDATNYEAIADKTATFIISKAVLTATVGDHARTYGAANPEFPVSVLGFVNGETASTAGGYVAPTASTSATTSTAVGTATITISGGSATNYSFNTSDTGTLTITKIAMTGEVTITGSAVFGQVLTAVPDLENTGTPTYQWKRNVAAISGATNTTYSLVEADIGKNISVTATATGTNYTGSITSEVTAAVTKAAGSALSGTFEAYYPIISASQTNITQDIINLIGFTANQTGIEASISTNGTTYGSYSSLEIDSRGRAMISVTSAQKIKLRYEATTTHYAGADLLLTVGEKDLAIGDYYAGGVVGYIYQSTDTGYMTNQVHGLIAAKADTSTNGSKWSSNNTLRIGTGVGIGTGSTNTDAIILALDGSEIGMYGAKEARLYTNGGYNDWFLPSWHELLQLRNNKLLIGNFDTSNWSTYMSSSESTQYGWDPEPFYHAVYFDTNLNNYVWDKPAATHIRAVRYF